MVQVIAITPYPIGIKYEDYVPQYVLLKLEDNDLLPQIFFDGIKYHYIVRKYFSNEQEAVRDSKNNMVKMIGEIKY